LGKSADSGALAVTELIPSEITPEDEIFVRNGLDWLEMPGSLVA
jgi:hypothetical protein